MSNSGWEVELRRPGSLTDTELDAWFEDFHHELWTEMVGAIGQENVEVMRLPDIMTFVRQEYPELTFQQLEWLETGLNELWADA